MTKRIAAIVFIWICTAVAWLILGGTIFGRTYSSDAAVKERVAAIWGTPHEQKPPTAAWSRMETRQVVAMENNKKVMRTVEERIQYPAPLESSRINVSLDLEHRQKGLLWYSTYKVDFAGLYTFRNTSDREQLVTFALPLPAEKAVYDNLFMQVDGEPLDVSTQQQSASGAIRVPAGKAVQFKAGYRSQGLDAWRYNFGGQVARVRDFALTMKTNFKDIDFPPDTLSPSEKREAGSGWELLWTYKNLLSGLQIGMAMPEKLQPGPLAGKISFFAPVSLFFFFFLMLIITTIRGVELHPMNYFFLAAAFFSFHLLLAYLVDHISIHLSFMLASLVSIALVISYLRLVTGIRFAAVEAGVAQVIYLVLFSYAFFFKGFTGLAITIGSIMTLFVVMQMTGRIRWADKFARPVPSIS